MNQCILLIDDDAIFAQNTRKVLERHGFKVEYAPSGKTGLKILKQSSIDLVLLDRVMPQMTGLEVCRQIRAFSKVPIIMTTSQSDVDARVEGLDAGATDYLSKPFEFKELLARIRAHLRYSDQKSAEQCLQFDDVLLYPEQYKVLRSGKELTCSPTEFDLLYYFMKHPYKALSKSHLINEVWGWNFSGNDNIVEVYVRKLRQKLEKNKQPRLIHTVHGVGYILKKTNQ